jgi:hypothetical protein
LACEDCCGGPWIDQSHWLAVQRARSIVLPGEADLAIVAPDQAVVGDGNAVSVATEIAEYLLGSREWAFGVDDPVDLGQRIEPGGEAHDWDALNRLYRKGMINHPVGKAKSIVLTDEGLSESERLFRKLFERSVG